MEFNWSSVLSDVYKNSSGYLISSIAVAVCSLIFVLLYERPAFKELFSNKQKRPCLNEGAVNAEPVEDFEEEEDFEHEVERVDVRSLADRVAASMTPQQKEHEKAVEQQQLAAIFKLLQNQEDKFHVSSVQQLEEQLSLYR